MLINCKKGELEFIKTGTLRSEFVPMFSVFENALFPDLTTSNQVMDNMEFNSRNMYNVRLSDNCPLI